MIGIGGNSLLIPILVIFLNLDIHVAIATMVFSSLFIGLSSLIVYFKNRVVDFKLAVLMEAGTIPGAFLAPHISILIPTEILTYIFVAAMILISGYMGLSNHFKPAADNGKCNISKSAPQKYYWIREYHYKDESRIAVVNVPLTITISFIIGLIVGLIGVAGGTMKVPFLTLVCGLPMIIAVGTAFLMITLTSISASLGYVFYGLIDFSIAIAIIIGLIIGSQLGSRVALKTSQKKLKIIFSIVLFLISIMMLLT
ncbi:MAG: sulfite exporter TauE/SafE family protein [Candidatus Odinarchaeum yellowstonii]|uniref:Probable membrane transporter protein n=1 Tax=Odinarchaeota yellowstonii (strain LCB_4) TaxID=1841599 RepID=A0AAF0D3S0_ODILC|nr:MAG: sulfite exporter TauE/SafE family protein [Candidatus Odinarchaeum yellowstonii]